MIIAFGITQYTLKLSWCFCCWSNTTNHSANYPWNVLNSISVLFLLNPSLKFAANTRTTITGGSISGFITGIVGTGGALRAMFLTGFNLEKTKYVATAAVIALATDSTRITSYLYQGFLLPQYYHYMPLFFATAIGGSFIGRNSW